MHLNSTSLSVITYNIHKGFGIGNRVYNFPEIVDAITEDKPDILCVQEILGQHDKKSKHHDHWSEHGQPDFLAKDNWPFFSYSAHADYQNGNHGNAIFSKFEMSDIEHLTLSKYSRSSRGIVYAVIYPDEKPIHLMCIHFGLLKVKRVAQHEVLFSILEKLPQDERVIISGDFNDWRLDDTNLLSNAYEYKEAYYETHGDFAKTYPAVKPMLKNDRIYYRNIELINANIIEKPIWKKLSDHLPLKAEFLLG